MLSRLTLQGESGSKWCVELQGCMLLCTIRILPAALEAGMTNASSEQTESGVLFADQCWKSGMVVGCCGTRQHMSATAQRAQSW